MKHEIYEVNSPKYLSFEEIEREYADNYVVVTNMTEEPKGGIVRYYCYAFEKALGEKMKKLAVQQDEYGDCIVEYVGQGRGYSMNIRDLGFFAEQEVKFGRLIRCCGGK